MAVDNEARNMASRALDRMDGHEDICAERYAGIIDSVKELRAELTGNYRSIISVGVLVIVSLVGFIFVQIVSR